LDNQTNKNTAYYLAKAGVELMFFFGMGLKPHPFLWGRFFNLKGTFLFMAYSSYKLPPALAGGNRI
jgi:hypothetical protein